MDSAAGQLVESLASPIDVGLLRLGDAVRKRLFEVARHLAPGKRRREPLDPEPELAGGEFGEGDRGDVLRFDAAGEQYGDASSHDRRLAGSGTRLHEQGA